jgi:hypothetical protein
VKKKRDWACKKGCDLSKGICPHLEKLLPSMNSGMFYTNPSNGKRSKMKYIGENIEAKSEPIEVDAHDSEAFEKYLKRFPITDIERNVLLDYFSFDLTFKQIADKRNFAGGSGAVSYIFKKTLAFLEAYMEDGLTKLDS